MASDPQPRRMVFCDGDVTQESIASWRNQILRHFAEDQQATITLVINSGGGSMAHALGFFKSMKDLVSVRFNTFCSNTAGSAALLLFMLGEQRQLAAGGNLYLHEAHAHLEGEMTAKDLEVLAVQMHAVNREYAQLIAGAGSKKLSADIVEDMMRKRTIIYDHDAVNLGLATEVVGAKRGPRSRKAGRG